MYPRSRSFGVVWLLALEERERPALPNFLHGIVHAFRLLLRKALGLEYRIRPVRPRLTLSLNDHDFEVLARLWGIDEHDRLRIKEEAALRLIRFANKEESESDND